MATRERKVSGGRRQQTASPSPKDFRSTPDQIVKNDTPIEPQRVPPQKTKINPKMPLVRKLTKGQKKKNQKKLSLKITSKATRKAKQKITKSLINTAKVLEAKKLLKNGKVPQKKEEEESDAVQHILEPLFPVDEELGTKTKKKRIVRNPAARRIKTEIEDPEICSDSSANSVKNSRRNRNIAKTEEMDTVTQTIEGVVSGFTLRPDEIKKEPDSMSESSRSDIIKPKRLTKKQKLCLLQKEIKKENIENALTNLGQSDQKVIDMLDLNVLKVKKTYPKQKRRHTIEKYPMGTDYQCNDDFPPLIPFSDIPKTKRKVRSCVENRVLNPYTIRPPARLLRNGKQRRMKEQLEHSLEDRRKKRRLCSEESEIPKLSGYDSDSSYSDLVSLSGADSVVDLKSVEIKKEQIDNHNTSSIILPANIKRSLSLENQTYCTDSNSNLCDDPNIQENKNTDNLKHVTMLNEDIYPSPSTKVPEKLLILDIMKQNFNEKVELEDQPTPEVQEVVRVSTEKLSPTVVEEKESEQKKMSEIISKIVETMGTEEFTATINPTAVVMQNGDIPWEDSLKIVEESASDPLQVEDEPTVIIQNEDTAKESSEIVETFPTAAIIIENEPELAESQIMEEVTDEVAPAINNEQEVISSIPEAISEIPQIAMNIPEEPIAGPSSAESPPMLEPVCCQPSTSKAADHLVQETEEDVAIKESMLSALGLRSLKAAEEARLREKEKPAASAKADAYTGTLKTVIKLNRDTKKKGKNHPLKMTLQKNKSRNGDGASGSQDDYKIMKEGSSSWKNSGQSSDSAGANRKIHYSNRSNPDGSSEHTTDGEAPNQEGPVKALVIPEKASSFSIHPERLCKDECSFCYGKFGLFDTPCHIAQIKTLERQEKILALEKNLTKDSCLCDACYRHIDRRANTPSYTNKSVKRGPMIAPGPKKNHCHVLGCKNVSANILRRKWIIKMRQQVMQTVNIDLNNLGLHSIPICQEHYTALEHLMVCSMCKRRLAKNHIHYLGPEVEDLNNALQEEQIPLKLGDKPVVCKLCRCFATVILKNPEDRPVNSTNFFLEYKKRLLHFNNIVPMDKAAAEEPIIVPTREKVEKEPNKKKRKLSKNLTEDESQPGSPVETSTSKTNKEQNGSTNSGSDSASEYLVDYHNLIPSIAMECEENESDKEKNNKGDQPKKILSLEAIKNSIDVTVKNPSSDLTVQRLGSNPYLSVRQLFPGEEELGLQGHIDFNNVKERTTEGWEKCNMTIQYDNATKHLWQELQKPYGNPSSFLRHLILLEKYFRNGDLELKPNASQQSVNYSECVQNRLRAYDNIPTGASRSYNIVELNSSTPMHKSSSGIITSNKEIQMQTAVPGLPVMTTPNVTVTSVRPPPVTITQLNNPLLPITITKTKPPPPPGLISLLPGTNRPIAPLTKQPQSQKIKFPITKNWRPTLIPIDPAKPTEKKSGLVQVISGGKPFHITLEDYKKMCAIKRSFEMKQKRQSDPPKRNTQIMSIGASLLKSNKGIVITKGLKIEPKQEQDTSCENILEKLDQQVENLESKFHENKSLLNMPRIPKSLTVIPQTIRKPSRPPSPVLLITPKPKS